MNRAILLCAGRGSRLQPLTDSVPKCLTEVHGKPILEQQIEALSKSGIGLIIIVVGYLKSHIIKHVRDIELKRKWPVIAFVHNPDYATTNSAYSLWLARHYLTDGCLILEGDVVFEPAVLPPLLAQDGSAIAVRQARVSDDGCIISAEDGMVQKMRIHQEPLGKVRPNQYKSCGIEKVDDMFGKAMIAEMDLEANLRTAYKDEIISHLLNLHDISIVDISDLKCQEIDTRSDLLKAESAFTRPKYVVVIMDGAADNLAEGASMWAGFYQEVACQTPLSIAKTPTLDSITAQGKTGLVQTMYPGLPLGSVVAMLGILGYNPTRYYPNGRASFEAIAQDIYLDEDEIAFRCNLVLLDSDSGELLDATPDLTWGFDNDTLEHERFTVYRGQSYRHLLIYKYPG